MKTKILIILIFVILLSGCIGNDKVKSINIDAVSEFECVYDNCWVLDAVNEQNLIPSEPKSQYRTEFNGATIFIRDFRNGITSSSVGKIDAFVVVKNVGFYEEENDMVTVYGDIEFNSKETYVQKPWGLSTGGSEKFDLATVYLSIDIYCPDRVGYRERIKFENIENGELRPFSVTIHLGK